MHSTITSFHGKQNQASVKKAIRDAGSCHSTWNGQISAINLTLQNLEVVFHLDGPAKSNMVYPQNISSIDTENIDLVDFLLAPRTCLCLRRTKSNKSTKIWYNLFVRPQWVTRQLRNIQLCNGKWRSQFDKCAVMTILTPNFPNFTTSFSFPVAETRNRYGPIAKLLYLLMSADDAYVQLSERPEIP